jgi:hypothetical protein
MNANERSLAEEITEGFKALETMRNNEPVAWAREDGVIAFHKQKEVDSQGYKWFPLYTHPAKILTDEEILTAIKCIADDVSPHKEYENTYEDGWIDACNTVYDEVFEILRKASEK